jgi:predicted nucleotidyltransferase component of viral defense system
MNDKEQELLARVICLFADKFGNKCVLRGGMVLKLLGSPRFTNDLDYLFVPYRSKNDIVEEVVSCLKSIQGASVAHSLNSKCLRIVLKVDEVSIQIEAKVDKEMQSEVISNRLFSEQFNLPKKLIHIVDHSVAMANKMAAWNERRIIRDIYDIWFFMRMNIKPDQKTLNKRLAKPRYARRVAASEKFDGQGAYEFYEFLRERVSRLTQSQIEEQLADYFLPGELTGMADIIKASFATFRLN